MSAKIIPLAGVIGFPISHAKSPRMHRHWLRKYGRLGHYVPLHIHEDDLENILRTMPKMGFVGVNVTIPHKTNVMAIADHISDRATLIGAANTLNFRDDGSIYADNTDGYGFMSNLKQGAPGWDPAAGPAAIFGAGGAARAIIELWPMPVCRRSICRTAQNQRPKPSRLNLVPVFKWSIGFRRAICWMTPRQ